ncbi:MAG: ParB/RepB/Spo0J family partition protein, partial [Phycisphaerae bacterium]
MSAVLTEPTSGRVEYRTVSISSLRPFPENSRTFKPFAPENCEDDSLLVESIRRIEILSSPVVAKIAGNPDYVIISGHRRIAAAKVIGQSSVHCKIVPSSGSVTRKEQWLAGNLTRQ